MSMFDWYIPEPVLNCPHCGATLDGWQGKDGGCGLLVWRQGNRRPIDQRVDDEIKWSPEELGQFESPSRFIIYTECCSHDFFVEAICTTQDTVWSDCKIVTTDEVEKIHGNESKSRRAARRAWIEKGPV